MNLARAFALGTLAATGACNGAVAPTTGSSQQNTLADAQEAGGSNTGSDATVPQDSRNMSTADALTPSEAASDSTTDDGGPAGDALACVGLNGTCNPPGLPCCTPFVCNVDLFFCGTETK